MAVKYAVANGNWNAGATWNGGTVPQSGDYVYLNGKTINGASNLNIGSGTISNKANADYGVNNGGILDYGITLTAINIVANIEVGNTYIFFIRGTNAVVNILGNIEGGFQTFNCVQDVTFTITGNCYDVLWWENSTTLEVTINGNLTNIRANKMTKLTVNGNYTRTLTGGTFNPTAFLINGNIRYESNTNYVGLTDITKLTILNPDTFTWKDVTEPRSNPFIILTDAEMNNRQQYPPEDVVKQGAEYVWGEKVGTYQQPPESVVLKGYRYDNDEKEGTLENEVIVDNTNTINVFPYKRRNNG